MFFFFWQNDSEYYDSTIIIWSWTFNENKSFGNWKKIAIKKLAVYLQTRIKKLQQLSKIILICVLDLNNKFNWMYLFIFTDGKIPEQKNIAGRYEMNANNKSNWLKNVCRLPRPYESCSNMFGYFVLAQGKPLCAVLLFTR